MKKDITCKIRIYCGCEGEVTINFDKKGKLVLKDWDLYAYCDYHQGIADCCSYEVPNIIDNFVIEVESLEPILYDARELLRRRNVFVIDKEGEPIRFEILQETSNASNSKKD